MKESKKVDFRTAWRAARDILWQHRWRLALGLGLILVNRVSAFVLPSSSKYLIDEVIANRRTEMLGVVVLVVAIATLIQTVSSFTLNRFLTVTAERSIAEMQKGVAQHVIRLPVAYFDSARTGTLISRIMTDAEGLRSLVGVGVVQLVSGLVSAVIALTVLFYLNWVLTTYTLAVLLLFGGMMAVAFRHLRPLFRKRNELRAEVSGRLAESLAGIRIVKSYTAEKREDRAIAGGIHRLFRNIAKTTTGTAAVNAATVFLFGSIGVLIMVLGSRAIVAGTMTLGDLMMYVLFTSMATTPMTQIAASGTQITQAIAGLDRIRELRRMTTEEEDDEQREPVGPLAGDVRFDRVCFEYEDDTPVLTGVSFDAPAGTTTALVGSSGSGKSTIIGLVMAFYRPQSGRLLVDGRDLSRLRLYEYRSHVGIVMQDNFLFDGTIAENIAYANPGADRNDIERAGAIAHCDAFVSDFEKGYDTVVGERGVKLSGGQRQRVAIARAILADPRILILDEATSSLDSESEALIQDGIDALRRGRTTFVIAHRLSTIRSADQILVVEEGRIVERGTHAELLAAGGRYRELYDKQYALERNLFINPGEEPADLEPEPLPEPAEL